MLIDYLASAPEGEAACADDAMDARWFGPDDLGHIPLATTMWPLLEKLFNRNYADRYQRE